MSQKAKRISAMGKYGFCRKTLARATIMPAASYGAETTGFADTALAKLRADAVRAVATTTAGGSTDPEWAARDGYHGRLDPAFGAHTGPISFLATAWWENWRDPQSY